MGKILITGGDVAQGLFEVRELAIGIQRVEPRETERGVVGTLGFTALGVREVSFTAHLLAGGSFQAITDQDTYEILQTVLQHLG